MAVRIQFRRGTAAEWTAANPTLAAGELGYETDTTKFKLGDGSNDWDTLTYAGITQADLEAAVESVVGLAPSDLDTLVELAASIGDDPDFINTINSSLDTHSETTIDVHGIPDTSLLETSSGAQTKANNAQANAAAYTDNAIANLIDSSPSTLNTLNELAAALGDDPNFATTISSSIGTRLSYVVDTFANLVSDNVVTAANTIYIASDALSVAVVGDGITNYNDVEPIGQVYANEMLSESNDNLSDHEEATLDVHGIANTANLAYTSDVTGGIASHSAVTLNVHGIANTAELITTSDLEDHNTTTQNVHGIADTAELITTSDLEDHNTTTQNVHGIANTAALVTNSVLDTHAETTQNVHGITNAANLIYTSDLHDHSTTTINVHGIANTAELVVASELAEHADATLNVHGIANTAELVVVSDLGGASATEIGYLFGVSANIQEQLDLRAPTYSPTFSGTVVLPTDTSIGNVSASALASLENVVSDVQQQLNAKADNTTMYSSFASLGGATFVGTVVIDQMGSLTINDPMGSVSSNTLIYMANVSSNVQDQLNNKLDNTTAGMTYAPIDNASLTGTVSLPADTTIGNVTPTILTYLQNVSSDVQEQFANVLPLSGGTLTGALTLSGDPTQALHAVTKEYADNLASGVAAKPQCDVATTEALTATYDNGLLGVGATLNLGPAATLTIDGESSWAEYDGILVKDQANAYENGRYYVSQVGDVSTDWILTRCGYCDTADEIPGGYIFVTDGSLNAQTGWVMSVADPDTFTVGADAINIYQFSGAGTVTAGNNISVSGNQVSVLQDPILGTVSAYSLGVQGGGVMFGDNTIQYSAGVPSLSSFTEKTSSYTLDDLYLRDGVVEMNSSSATTFTIPEDNDLAWPVGGSMDIIQTGSGQVTIANAVGVTLNYTPGNKLRTQWSSCTIMKRSSNTWIMYGDLTA